MSSAFLPETIEFFPHSVMGEVEQTITLHQRGRVKSMGTTWFARLYVSDSSVMILPDSTVKVIGREGLTLLVVPSDGSAYQALLLDEPANRNQPDLLKVLQQLFPWIASN